MNEKKEFEKILKENEIKVRIIHITESFPSWDKINLHNQYKVVIRRGKKEMQFDFWDSIYNTEKGLEPSSYDVMSALEWFEIYSFEDFCMNFGYNEDSIKALKIYNECKKQQDELFEIIPEIEIREKIVELI